MSYLNENATIIFKSMNNFHFFFNDYTGRVFSFRASNRKAKLAFKSRIFVLHFSLDKFIRLKISTI